MRFAAKRRHPFHFKTHDPELDRLLQPAVSYRSPSDVVTDPDLDLPEKKAILASWASDACAVKERPAFRHPAGLCHPVPFDDIMMALQELDRRQDQSDSTSSPRPNAHKQSPVC